MFAGMVLSMCFLCHDRRVSGVQPIFGAMALMADQVDG